MGCFGSKENVKKNTQGSEPEAGAAPENPNPAENYDQDERPPSDTIAMFNENSYQHQETNFDDMYNIRHNLQSKMNEFDMDSVFGDNEIRKFYNRNDIDNESMNTAVKESLFDEHWEKTCYYKWFSTTSRNEDLLEAITDLLVIAPKNKVTFMKFYKEFKDTPQKVVTLIWTYEPQKQGEIRIYKLINMALIIDAKNTFGDGLKGNIKFATDFISQCNIDDVDHIIKHSIKFIRILNTALVDEGSKFNTSERVTYRGVDKKVFMDTEVGDTYRMITWCCSSEDKDTAEKILKKSTCGASMIKFNIPKGCKNAGKINCFGKSCIPGEKVTLIPPYTSIKMEKIDENTSLNYYEVYITKDCHNVEFIRNEYNQDGKVIELDSPNTSGLSSF